MFLSIIKLENSIGLGIGIRFLDKIISLAFHWSYSWAWKFEISENLSATFPIGISILNDKIMNTLQFMFLPILITIGFSNQKATKGLGTFLQSHDVNPDDMDEILKYIEIWENLSDKEKEHWAIEEDYFEDINE